MKMESGEMAIRTSEQVKADAKLAEAVEMCLRAYNLDLDGSEVLSDFIVLCATQKLNEDNTLITGYPMLLRDGDIPWYRVVGLLSIHEGIINNVIISGGDNG